MEISRKDLERLAVDGVISGEQADRIWITLESRNPPQARFEVAHVAYYFGALLVIGAMGWFMTRAIEELGGLAIFSVATVYAIVFIVMGALLWKRPALRIPGGLLYTIAVSMVPLMVYGLERFTGAWPENDPGGYAQFHTQINGNWLFMEIATISAAALMLWQVPFAFMTTPLIVALLYLSMDAPPLILCRHLNWDEQLWVSTGFGLLLILAAFLVDRRTKQDFAFWAYLWGTVSFWFGLSLMHSGSELKMFIYAVINLSMMAASVLVGRLVLIIFGSFGVCWYLGHLAHSVFGDSLIFPVALSLIGVAIIFGGVLYARNRKGIEASLLNAVPVGLRKLLPSQRVAP
jgi:hypothetical protein